MARTFSITNVRLVAGAPSLDLANTINSRIKPRHDLITGYDALLAWSLRVGTLDAGRAQALSESRARTSEAAEITGRAIALRESIYGVFSAAAAGRTPAPPDLEIVQAEYALAVEHASFDPTPKGLRPSWDTDNDAAVALHPIAFDAGELLTSARLAHVKECPACSWLFLDTSRNQSRRWCEMRTCGSRDKMRRYHKARAAASTTPRTRRPARLPSLDAAFVNRSIEVGQLGELISAVSRTRRPRLISIVGPSGIGKSRLVREVEHQLGGARGPRWHHGRSPAYGDATTFWALGEIVRDLAGLTESDAEATTRDRIRALVARHVPATEDARLVEPALLTLFALEPAGPTGEVLLAAWRILFENVASRETTILVFEDMHQADRALLDFLEYLLQWITDAPLVIITLARQELLDRRPGWALDARTSTQLVLAPLADVAVRDMVSQLVPGLPELAVSTIVERSAGVPLYAIETVRALVADGRIVPEGRAYRPVGELGTLVVPATLRSLILTRLDTFEPADRELISDAAVLGQSFGLDTLAAVSGRPVDAVETRLAGLVRRQVVELVDASATGDRQQHRFVQALIRDVAYDALGPAERRARHLAAARYFERVDNDEQAGLLASHYLAAMEASSPGPEARALAIQSRLALVGAAERAAALGAHERATEYLRQAASLVDDDHVKIDLVIRAANSAEAGGAHETAEELAREAAALANALGNRADVGRALALTGEALIGRGLLHEAISVLEAALRAQDDGATSLTGAIDQSAGDPDGLAALLASLSRAQMRADLPVAAIGTADRALEIAERRGLDWIVAETFNNKGSSLCALGRKREAAALINAAIDVAREGGLVAAEVRATTNLAHMTEDLHLGRDLYLRSARLARRAGNRTGAMWAAAAARMLAYELAEGWDAAVAEAAVEITDAGPGRALPPLDEIRARYGAGLIRVARGLSVDTDIERLAELCNLVSDGIGRAVLHVLTGESALLGGDGRAAVAELLGAADALAKESTVFLAGAMRAAVWGRDLAAAREVAARLERDPSTSTPTEARRLVARAGVAALEGRAPDAARLYGDGIARLRNHGLAFEQARCTLDAAMLLSPAEPAIASELEAARRIFERVGAAPYLDRLAAITAGSGPREAARR